MARVKRWILLFVWFMVTYHGAHMAGPFVVLSDCQDVARVMAKQNPNISTVCQWEK